MAITQDRILIRMLYVLRLMRMDHLWIRLDETHLLFSIHLARIPPIACNAAVFCAYFYSVVVL